MGFLGVNPRRNVRLDALGKTRVTLLGIPAPYGLPSASGGLGSSALEDLILELSQRREKLVHRVNRDDLSKDEKLRMDSLARDTFGTAQQPLMLLFEEALFSGFIPDLMSSDELQGFSNTWATRGFTPIKISAVKEGRYWTYTLEGNFGRT
jgi:hypothetical protein